MPNSLRDIKEHIEQHIGDKVTLKSNSGRKKYVVREGTIESAYPSIFLIKLQDDNQKVVTFSYSDVLTRTVQLNFS